MNPSAPYVGRFAPSPTGPLHLGSLVAALGSFLEARAAGGTWRLRIDDIDRPRQARGAAELIPRQLEALGLHWDGPIAWQSQSSAPYREALERLAAEGATYLCSCTRREIAAGGNRGPLGAVYAGYCRNRPRRPAADTAVRLRLPDGPLEIHDGVQGPYALDAAREIGDVVLRRRDGLWAYHLATTIDDAVLGVTHVVRGADLLAAALVQSELQRRLALPGIAWTHLPVVQWPSGEKLSKQTAAPALDTSDPVPALQTAWWALGQDALPDTPVSARDFLVLARARWNPRAIPHGPIEVGTP